MIALYGMRIKNLKIIVFFFKVLFPEIQEIHVVTINNLQSFSAS